MKEYMDKKEPTVKEVVEHLKKMRRKGLNPHLKAHRGTIKVIYN